MALPPLDQRGLLPPGIHDCTWREIEVCFCTSHYRENLYNRVRQGIREEVIPKSPDNLEFCIAGSFLSDKESPADIEVTVAVTRDDIINNPTCIDIFKLGSREERARLKAKYKLDFIVSAPFTGHNDLRLYFQYVGDKTAASKNLDPKDKRGIVRVRSWQAG